MLILTILLVFISDQWLKIFITNNFNLGQTLPIWQDVFHITYVQNTGAAFGILKGSTDIFIIFTIIVITAIILYRLIALEEIFILDLSFGLIIGGALGNLIDRFRLGYVIDYLDFQVWPVFNMADSTLVIGAALLIYYLWQEES